MVATLRRGVCGELLCPWEPHAHPTLAERDVCPVLPTRKPPAVTRVVRWQVYCPQCGRLGTVEGT